MPITISEYSNENQLADIIALIDKDLSEPYCIYTYRYFLHTWPDLCFLAHDENEKIVGVIICRLEQHKSGSMRGYIAMLAVHPNYRKQGIATRLVERAVEAVKAKDGDEVVLEAEESNIGAVKLYERVGFFRDKRLEKYYLNGSDAFRLKLIFN